MMKKGEDVRLMQKERRDMYAGFKCADQCTAQQIGGLYADQGG